MGPYLRRRRPAVLPDGVEVGLYYGVDTDFFRPADPGERAEPCGRVRAAGRRLPGPRCSSRISHEKDAGDGAAGGRRVRRPGLDAVVLNLGGGYKEFLELAAPAATSPDADRWVIGRPAAAPDDRNWPDYYRAPTSWPRRPWPRRLGLAPLEAWRCGVPVVACRRRRDGVTLPRTCPAPCPRRDAAAMARATRCGWPPTRTRPGAQSPWPGRSTSTRLGRADAFADRWPPSCAPADRAADAAAPTGRPDRLPGRGVAEHGPVRRTCSSPTCRGRAVAVEAGRLCPPFRRVATRLPAVGRRNAAFNADRLLNRFVLFPRYARRSAARFDLFHVVDHTYAQLVHALPAGRAGVYCHDLDAFRCLLDPAADPRPRWFRGAGPPHPDRAAEGGGRVPQLAPDRRRADSCGPD